MSDIQTIKILLLEDSPTDARLLMQSLKEINDPLFEITWVETLARPVTAWKRASLI